MSGIVIANLLVIAFFWTVAYLLIIYRSHKDKVYGMPAIACFGNIAWEAYYIFFAQWNAASLIINSVWFFLDLIILYQVFLYAPKEFPKLKPASLYFLFISGLALAFSINHYGYQSDAIIISSAFAQNLVMSFLFILMILRRKNTRGQSLYIAGSKALGTFFVVILFHFVQKSYLDNTLLHMVYITVILLDLIYFALLYYFLRLENKNPWKQI